MHRLGLFLWLLLVCPLCLAGTTNVTTAPAASILDPQGVLSGSLFGSAQIPVGASAVLIVEGGKRHIEIQDTQNNLTEGGTLGGSLGGHVVSNLMIRTFLLGGFDLSPLLSDSYDLSRDGKVDIADLVWVNEYSGKQVNTGGDPLMFVASRPDGEGPLNDRSVLGQSPMVVYAGEDPVTGTNGEYIDLLEPKIVDNLMSLCPSSVEVHPGDLINIGLQIDSSAGFGQTKGYTAQIALGSGLSFEGPPRGSNSNGDFTAQPVFIYPDSHTVQIGYEAPFRSDFSEPVINVANFNVRVSNSVSTGSVPLVVLEQGTLIPTVGNPIPPPTVKLLGCGIYVLPF